MDKSWVAKWETFDAILDILRWSLDWAAKGKNPPGRHDNQDWLPSDTHRAKIAGDDIGAKALLCMVTGDKNQ